MFLVSLFLVPMFFAPAPVLRHSDPLFWKFEKTRNKETKEQRNLSSHIRLVDIHHRVGGYREGGSDCGIKGFVAGAVSDG